MNIKKNIKDNRSRILTGIGVCGVFTTTGLAIKATPEAEKQIDLYRQHHLEEPTVLEKAKLVYKFYIPTAISAIGTTAAIVAAQCCNESDKAVAIAAASTLSAMLTDYKEAVVETIGEELGEEVRKNAAQKDLDRRPYSRSKESLYDEYDDEDYLCYEPLTGRYFRSNKLKIDSAMNEVCREIIGWDEADLNSLFSRIGLKENELGSIMGWKSSVHDLPRVTYSAQITDDGRPVIWLDYSVCPCVL